MGRHQSALGARTLRIFAVAAGMAFLWIATSSRTASELDSVSGPPMVASDLEDRGRVPRPRPMMEVAVGDALVPDDVRAAYHLDPSLDGEGVTIAIVVAYHNPDAESDLAVFSKRFGLPACTAGSGCFRQVSPGGRVITLHPISEWIAESSLNVQWAHAMAPRARILLVEARTDAWSDMVVAVDYAAARARYVSMSWGSAEFPQQSSLNRHFDVPGVSFFASAGNVTGVVHFPSASPHVLSVGGTVLANPASPVESIWSGSGWGCSRFEPSSSAQEQFTSAAGSGCDGARRATPDVTLVAEPGVSIYWGGRWRVGGGTSAAAAIVAARAAASRSVVDARAVYSDRMSFRGVIGASRSGAAAYDARSGRGSWIGQLLGARPAQSDRAAPSGAASCGHEFTKHGLR